MVGEKKVGNMQSMKKEQKFSFIHIEYDLLDRCSGDDTEQAGDALQRQDRLGTTASTSKITYDPLV